MALTAGIPESCAPPLQRTRSDHFHVRHLRRAPSACMEHSRRVSTRRDAVGHEFSAGDDESARHLMTFTVPPTTTAGKSERLTRMVTLVPLTVSTVPSPVGGAVQGGGAGCG